MIKSYLLFTTPMCPNCPEVKVFMEDVDLAGELVDASKDEGLKKASEHNVMSVPTAIFFDEDRKETARASTVDEIKQLLNL